MMSNFKLAPSKIERQIPKDLYEKLKGRQEQEHVVKVEKMIRIDALIRVMTELSQEQQETYLEQHRNKFVPKDIIFFIFINKEEVV